jgi:hypothetical protein
MLDAAALRGLVPSSAIPIAYFVFAHAGLALALIVLTWQTHAAFLWLVVAAGLGLLASVGVPGPWRATRSWIYGVAGLMGFLAQIVVGIQGRLVPFYAWYRAFAARGGQPPPRAANALPSATFARFTFAAWTGGVPLLAFGLAVEHHAMIRVSALLLLAGVLADAAYLAHMIRSVQIEELHHPVSLTRRRTA